MKPLFRVLLVEIISLTWPILTHAQTCTYSLSSSGRSFPSSGGTNSFAVNTDSSCTWTAVSTVAWLTIIENTSGAGTNTVSYLVATNNSPSSRSGTLTVTNQTFTIAQAGALTAAICPVKLAGVLTLTYEEDPETQVRVNLTKRDILSTNTNRLALELDFDANTLRLIETDEELAEVNELATSEHCAFLAGNLFAGDLVFESLAVFNATVAVDFEGNGSLQVRGSYTVDSNGAPSRVSAKLIGVMNDPVANPAGPAAMFKGIFSSDGRAVIP